MDVCWKGEVECMTKTLMRQRTTEKSPTPVLTVSLRLNEPVSVHLHNAIGIAYVRSGINQSFPVSSPQVSANPAEHGFEVNLVLGLPRGLLFQPVVQYYMNSGGSSHNAVVVGFHTRIDF
jgi:hypothetical protein